MCIYILVQRTQAFTFITGNESYSKQPDLYYTDDMCMRMCSVYALWMLLTLLLVSLSSRPDEADDNTADVLISNDRKLRCARASRLPLPKHHTFQVNPEATVFDVILLLHT